MPLNCPINSYPIHRLRLALWIGFTLLFVNTTSFALDKASYHKLTLEGWEVHIAQSLVEKNDYRVFLALQKLSEKLQEIKLTIPRRASEQLSDVPIWISENGDQRAEFYFFEAYVYRTDKDIQKMDGIEFQSIRFFLNELRYSPMLVLHELAHAYHKKNYKRIDKLIMRAYKNALTQKLYQNVKTINDKYERAYALQSPFEYFAELTETFFGRNNYYPFNKNDLREYDPMGYEMIENTWISTTDYN